MRPSDQAGGVTRRVQSATLDFKEDESLLVLNRLFVPHLVEV